jgi:hypothetical protein
LLAHGEISVKSTKGQELRSGYLYFVPGYSEELELTVIKVENGVESIHHEYGGTREE